MIVFHVLESFATQQLKYLLDGGPCEIGLESTVVDLCHCRERRPIILRPGAVSGRQISEVLGIEVFVETLSIPPKSGSEAESRPRPSPGLMHKHYSPRTPLAIQPRECWPDTISESKQKKIARIAFQKPKKNEFPDSIGLFWLTQDGNLEEAARNLFHLLRKVDQMDFNQILIEPAPETGLGAVINERLHRACGKTPDAAA